MSDETPTSVDPAALAALPVFPLPRVVLLPGLDLPLHIFEPRYRAMTRDALATHRALAVTMLGPQNGDTVGRPPMARTAGAGVIIEDHERPDGRFDIVVRGLHRVVLEELPREGLLYRRARAIVLPDGLAAPSDRAAATALLAIASQVATRIRQQKPDFELPLNGVMSPGRVADVLAGMLVLEPDRRQEVLETLDVARRLAIVNEEAVELFARLVRDPDGHDFAH
ncbi:MAG: LON peptidase substrate-binding domain-containing protein [Deltaproteobacteria bacterium]|nr:LON peptidase substrate-binding domain-containing protein [Deltaproteobacteria bacterium]